MDLIKEIDSLLSEELKEIVDKRHKIEDYEYLLKKEYLTEPGIKLVKWWIMGAQVDIKCAREHIAILQLLREVIHGSPNYLIFSSEHEEYKLTYHACNVEKPSTNRIFRFIQKLGMLQKNLSFPPATEDQIREALIKDEEENPEGHEYLKEVRSKRVPGGQKELENKEGEEA